MAINLRELPIWIQTLLFLAIAVAVVLAFEFVPYSPLQDKRVELATKKQEANNLQGEVTQLQTYEQRRAELRAGIEGLRHDLELARSIVPEEKEVDEFIRIIQGEAAGAGVAIRRLTAKPLNPREDYVEMPFEIEADGPYDSLLDFFSRLGHISRVINVGDMTLTGYEEMRGKKYPARPGTTVSGTFTATSFFTKGAEAPAPAKQPGKQPAKR